MGPLDLLATPDADNLAWKLAENLLPTETATGFTVGLSVFIPALIFIASMMMAWHVLLGIVSSAYSGKVLGEPMDIPGVGTYVSDGRQLGRRDRGRCGRACR